MTPSQIANLLSVPGSNQNLHLIVTHRGKNAPYRGWLEDNEGKIWGRLENFKFNFLKFSPVTDIERKSFADQGAQVSYIRKTTFVHPMDDRISYCGKIVEIDGYLKGLVTFDADSSIQFRSEAPQVEILLHAHSWSGCAAIVVNGDHVETVDLFNQEISIIKRVMLTNEDRAILDIRIMPVQPANARSQGSQILLEGYVEYSDELEPPEFVEPPATNKGGGFRKRFYEIASKLAGDAVILDVGGGKRQLGDARYINLDYSSLEEPDIYGDGCRLPFRDESIDFVYTAAVLEHVRDPRKVGKEIHRVLKPGGHVLANSAFMQPVHSEGQHFFNLTPYGIDLVFREFKEREIWWETAFAHTMEWIVRLSEVKNVAHADIAEFLRIARLIDQDVTPERGMYFASGVWLEARKPVP